MGAHAPLSPSAAHRWLICPGSVVLCDGIPDEGSEFAAEGTAAHELAEGCLSLGIEPNDLIHSAPAKNGIPFTSEMKEYVGQYVQYVRTLFSAPGAGFAVEQKVDMQDYVPDCWGTADVVGVIPIPETPGQHELAVIDLKYGRGVRVDAEGNPQLLLYALGAYQQLALVYNIVRIRMVVHQPRLDHVDEDVIPREVLDAFSARANLLAKRVEEARKASKTLPIEAWSDAYLRPDNKACRWCRAAPACPKLAAHVSETVGIDFDDETPDAELCGPPAPAEFFGKRMRAIPLIENWIKAVRAEVERRLLAGEPVQGFKLVQGRLGPRQWTDESAVEEYLRKTVRLRIEDAYDLKLISPTSAEKLRKAGILGERQWTRLQTHITRVEGPPSVAPESDKREALVVTRPSVDDFADETPAATAVSS